MLRQAGHPTGGVAGRSKWLQHFRPDLRATVSFEPEKLGISSATLLADPMHCDRAAFEQLLPAVAQAGFPSVSLWPWHAQAVGPPVVRSMLADAGLSVAIVEALTQWARGVGPELRDEAEPMFDFASLFGADLVLACVLEPRIESLDRAVEGFRAVCDLATSYGKRVCLEFLPWSAIADLKTAWQIVEGAERSNGGIVLDTWHWQRQPGGPDLGLLRRIPGDRIHHLQLCDASPQPSGDALTEAMSARLLPGAGIVDIQSVVGTLVDIGADPFVGAEVFNSDLAAKGPAAMARWVREACSTALRGSVA
jgi:sugar phosphate isomerase/epimerase